MSIIDYLYGFKDYPYNMFVMKKDFQHASESISDKIGKKYVIKQINETESVIEEEI